MTIQSIDQVRPLAHTQDQIRAMGDEFREMAAVDLRDRLTKERKALADTMQLASRNGEDGQVIYDFSDVDGWKDKTESERQEEFGKANDRLNVMGAVLNEKTFYANLSNSLNQVPDETGDAPAYSPDQVHAIASANAYGVPYAETLGDIFANQPEYRANIIEADNVNRKGKGIEMKGLEGDRFFNAVFQRTGVSSSGWEPQIIRSGRVVYADLRPDQLTDFLPRVQAMNGGYSWIQETAISAESTASREPSEKTEGAAAGQVTLQLTEKTVKVHKLPVFIPVTEEQLDDEAGARAYLEMRLPQQVRQRLDYQAINGDGSAPNMQGFLGVSGINTFAVSANSKILDQYIKAIEEIWVDTYRMANLALVRMPDCVKILNTKDTEGNFLYGSPKESAFMNRFLWGLRLIVNDALPANNSMVMDVTEKLMVMGKGVELMYGYQGDDFIKNIVTIRVSMRANFADLRPTSTCKITALNNAS